VRPYHRHESGIWPCAHGVPETLENALDWLVGSLDFASEPVALVNPSERSTHAHDSLLEILKTMAARLVPELGIVLPAIGRPMDASALLDDVRFSSLLRTALETLKGAACPEARTQEWADYESARLFSSSWCALARSAMLLKRKS